MLATSMAWMRLVLRDLLKFCLVASRQAHKTFSDRFLGNMLFLYPAKAISYHLTFYGGGYYDNTKEFLDRSHLLVSRIHRKPFRWRKKRLMSFRQGS